MGGWGKRGVEPGSKEERAAEEQREGLCRSQRHLLLCYRGVEGLPGGSEVKASASNAGDPGLIPGLGRSLGEGNGNPLQYSCLKNPMYRGAWQATVNGDQKEAEMTKGLNNNNKHKVGF